MASTHSTGDHFVFFYSNMPSASNRENGYLAQTYRRKALEVEGQAFKSLEQYYQWRKAHIIARHAATCSTTTQGRKRCLDAVAEELPLQILGGNNISTWQGYGRAFQLSPAAMKEWGDTICEVLYVGNFWKFHHDDGLRKQLLDTGDRYLIEACPATCTCVCGIGVPWKDDPLSQRHRWNRNLLGKALMLVRKHLRVASRYPFPSEEELQEAKSLEELSDGRNFVCGESCHGPGGGGYILGNDGT